ncbi:hypothetical protein GOP47_0009212 [Adiantum capillus-veneris]|uniref:Uncharacterized protein n=1 Tax=Adiantum capillus-veneris TaxID=13818 RepID=A0A9D4UWB2_ADICA|nr:hypothetical protein GOP47_0009212 [Adiantum capillus-veneris]
MYIHHYHEMYGDEESTLTEVVNVELSYVHEENVGFHLEKHANKDCVVYKPLQEMGCDLEEDAQKWVKIYTVVSIIKHVSLRKNIHTFMHNLNNISMCGDGCLAGTAFLDHALTILTFEE